MTPSAISVTDRLDGKYTHCHLPVAVIMYNQLSGRRTGSRLRWDH